MFPHHGPNHYPFSREQPALVIVIALGSVYLVLIMPSHPTPTRKSNVREQGKPDLALVEVASTNFALLQLLETRRTPSFDNRDFSRFKTCLDSVDLTAPFTFHPKGILDRFIGIPMIT